MASSSVFVPGDLVISVYGDGDGSGTYTDDQAAPITLEQINPATGAMVPITGSATGTLTQGGALVLPQAASGSNNAISGAYGAQTEGTLQLSADGQSLTIVGYGVSAQTYNAGGGAVYGSAALPGSTSIQGGSYTAVSRVVADINAGGTVDTSTELYGVFNTNSPSSAVTVNGSSFYVSGQGVKGDTTQGVFLAQDGASSTTAIDTSTNTRAVEIYNGTLYVSRDSKQGPTDNISSYAAEPTAPTAPTTLPGISGSVTLSAAQENGVNNGSVGTKVNISPEEYFFANAKTLYIADSGKPSQGGLGDGGLQKWSLNSGTWSLDYTLSAGLNLVANTSTSGTTGLFGLTGAMSGNSVSLYATNLTVGDTNQTYLYGTTDQLNATSLPTNETFTQLATAAPDTAIRGVAFAPTVAAVACFVTGTRIRVACGGAEVDVAVEALRAGDIAVTASGAHRPIRWVGHRTLDPRRHAEPHHAQPVRVRAQAIALGRPARDLLVSPGHALCLDLLGEVLVPAMALINGVTVIQEEVDRVTYWHVELDGGHEVILAENMPAESYLDTGNRRFFADEGVVDLDGMPDADATQRTHADFCRPFHADGAFVDVVRAQLQRRLPALGWRLEQPRPWEGVALIIDGRSVLPKTRGLIACFELTAGLREGTADVWLISPTSMPSAIGGNRDDRALGLSLASITFDDGLGKPRAVTLDDVCLSEGFHEHEGTHRWTTGRARLPVDLLIGLTGTAFLRLELNAPPVPRWVTPAEARQEDDVAQVA